MFLLYGTDTTPNDYLEVYRTKEALLKSMYEDIEDVKEQLIEDGHEDFVVLEFNPGHIEIYVPDTTIQYEWRWWETDYSD